MRTGILKPARQGSPILTDDPDGLENLELSTADWAVIYSIPERTMRHLIARGGLTNRGRKSRPRYSWDDVDKLVADRAR